MRGRFFLLSAVAIFSFPFLSASTAPTRDGFSTKVEIQPGKRPSSFHFKAKVTDLATGKPVAGADLTVAPGETATADAVDPKSNAHVIFTAKVEKAPLRVAYSFVVSQRNRVVAEHQGAVALGTPQPKGT